MRELLHTRTRVPVVRVFWGWWAAETARSDEGAGEWESGRTFDVTTSCFAADVRALSAWSPEAGAPSTFHF